MDDKVNNDISVELLTPFYISNADYFYKKLNSLNINNLNINI